MLVENKQIAIVGGGTGGLTLARLLQQKNVNVKVYERDVNRSVRVQGATLDLHDDSGLKALRAANLLEEFKNNFRPGADRMVIVDEKAKLFFSDHDNKPKEDFGDKSFRPEIDRGPLRNLLLNSLKDDTVVWDSQFTSMEKQNNGWLLHFKNGTSFYADIVIAADGANSKIRPYITDIKSVYSGVFAVEGNVYNSEVATPNIHKLLKGGKIFAHGKSQVFVVSSKGEGDLTFYASCKVDENWVKNNGINFSDKAQVLAWFKKEFPDWSKVWHELFENASTAFVPRQLNCMPLNQTWEALPNLTMLGDAAHLMPPFAGEGVNMAMLDALELSECLTSEKFENTQEAIAFYEKQMRKRASKSAAFSLYNGEWMHSENGLKMMLQMFNSSSIVSQLLFLLKEKINSRRVAKAFQ